MNMKRSKYIDHTLLKADATQADIERLCREAKDGDFASVCVNTYWVPLCAKLLAESDLKIRDVALQVGMSDQLYFNKIFRRHYGCSPSEYRRRLFKESQSPTLPDDPNTH